MSLILQLTRQLTARPDIPSVAGVTLRKYRGSADIDVWLEIRRQAFAREKLGVGRWDRGDFEREFLYKDWWRPGSMWFAELEPVPDAIALPTGTVTLARRGTVPESKPVVHWLAVVPSARRRGIGRLLMATLEAACWDRGERRVWLETHADWSRGVAFYQALGYEPA